jgi:L-ascorbate metabolism protein UlaG (beta-lactamase superfamily)
LSLLSRAASAVRRTRRAFPVSDHCDGERFFNPGGGQARPLGDVVTWQRTRVRSPWPESVPLTPYPPPPPQVEPGAIAATFVGHSTFLLRTTGAVILTDPMFATHAGPFGRLGPRRVRRPGLPLERVPIPDLVLVSHNHYDHLQPSSLRRCAHGAEPQFVAPLGLGPFLRRLTLQNVIELDWWESADLGASRSVVCVPAQHFSARTPFDRGFVVHSATETIYFAGDSGYGVHFAEIRRRCPSIDLALLPIGAYEPRWFMRPVHMNPAEAVQAHDDPLDALALALDERGLPAHAFRALDVGESAIVRPPPVGVRGTGWWR